MSNGVTIREARRQDAPAVRALWQEMMAFHRERDPRFRFAEDAPREFERHAGEMIRARDACVVVAEVGGQVVAYVMGELHQRKPLYPAGRYGFISDVCVSEPYRRQGIGRALVGRIMTWFDQREATAVELYVADRNPVSDAFWRAMGFDPFLRLMRAELRPPRL